MSSFIQSLENRTLFAAAFAAEQAQVVADAAAVRLALNTASKAIAAEVKTLAADLRPLTTPTNRATNRALLKALKTDVAASMKTLRLDGRNLLTKSTALSRKVAATGHRLTLRPGDPKLMAKLATDLPALVVTTAASVLQLGADLAAVDFAPELTALAAANPTGTVLAGHAISAGVNAAASLAAFAAAAATFQTNVGILASHVDALPDTPSLVGTWAGDGDETFGPDTGTHFALVARFTSQSATGALTGTVRVTPTGGGTVTMTLTGTVTEDGAFNATATGNGETSTLTGTVNGSTISGTYTGTEGGGTFSITRA